MCQVRSEGRCERNDLILWSGRFKKIELCVFIAVESGNAIDVSRIQFGMIKRFVGGKRGVLKGIVSVDKRGYGVTHSFASLG